MSRFTWVPYKRVLNQELPGRIHAVRAAKKVTVPVVMTRDGVAAVISLMEGTAQPVAKLLYGSGLRMMAAARLRVKDIDVSMKQLTVRAGKGDKDRFTNDIWGLTRRRGANINHIETKPQNRVENAWMTRCARIFLTRCTPPAGYWLAPTALRHVWA